MEESFDKRSLITMKLLHYFITVMNYNPIILQGIGNEIWLENLDSDYKVVRLVSNHIHNTEQYNFDLYRTRRIVSQIKMKTFSFRMPVLSIYVDIGDDIKLVNQKNIDCIYLEEEKDLKKYTKILTHLPDITKNMKFSEAGMNLFLKITKDINDKNISDAKKNEDVFKPKVPYVTYTLIVLNIIIFLIMTLSGNFTQLENIFCNWGIGIKAGQYYRLITGAFIHGGIVHLLCNMGSLYIIGSQVESYFGKIKFIIIYLFSAIMGNLLSITLNTYASVGASGAIFGLLGCLLYFGYHYRVFLGNVIKSEIIPVIIFNLLLGFLLPGIDNFAHIGGLIGGILITMSLGVKYKSTSFEKINSFVVTAIFTLFLIYLGIFA